MLSCVKGANVFQPKKRQTVGASTVKVTTYYVPVVSDIYKLTVNWIAEPWLLHKDESCIVVQPAQKEASQVVNCVHQRPGIRWDQ